MTVPFFLRPSTRLREIDLTQYFRSPATSIGCVVGEFERGPLAPTYIPGVVADFTRKYGAVANPRISYAHDTCQAFLTESSNLLVKRVVNGALHAGVHIFLNTTTAPGALEFVPFAQGQEAGFSAGVPTPTIIQLSADLITGNQFAASVTDGVTVTAISPVTYATSHDATMANIASAIQTVLNGFATGGYVSVLPAVGGNRRRIAVYAPAGQTLELTSLGVTSGVTQPTVTQDTPNGKWLASVMAENPGVWGNDIGVKITGRNQGQRQRIRLLFNAKLITGNSFNATINDVAIAAPVAFATDSDTTMAAIATALTAHSAISSAVVETVAAGRENDRSILIISEDAGPDKLIVNSAAVTGGVSQAAITQYKVLDGRASDGTFMLEVFNRANTVQPDERYMVSLSNNLDARGSQTRADAVINTSSTPSDNIRVVLNPRLSTDSGFAATALAAISAPSLSVPTTIRWLTGGDNGLSVLSSHMRQAIQSLDDRVHYPFNILMNAGYDAIEVKQELVALARKRVDCFAVLDMPADRQGTAAARDYRLYDLNIDDCYGAIYTPDLLIADIATGERRYIPPSGYVGATYAHNDRVASIAHAPAGLNRGILKHVINLRINYKPGDEELLHPEGVNCIVDRPGVGPVIMGQETLQYKLSLMRSVHARRLVSNLEVGLVDGLDYTLFDPHTEFTRNQAVQRGNNFLKPFQRSQALYDFRIQCDADNNPPEIIDQDVLSYRVFLKVARAIKGIMLDVILTRTGASFEELETDMSII